MWKDFRPSGLHIRDPLYIEFEVLLFWYPTAVEYTLGITTTFNMWIGGTIIDLCLI
jgi:hypothetical protein